VNDKRVAPIWRREGLKVPARQPRRGRLRLSDGSCLRRRAEPLDHVWSHDFVEDRTHDGRKFRRLDILDEFTHECSPSGWRASSRPPTSLMHSRICSSGVASQVTSDRTTARNSSPSRCRLGLPHAAPRQPASPRARPGRTATCKRSMPGGATSCSMARYSIRRARRRSSARAGGGTMIRSGHRPLWDTDHQPRRYSRPPSPSRKLRRTGSQ
jgi:hypothetical protein